MSPRTGRPKVENPKTHSIKIRFDENTNNKLNAYSEKHNMARTDVIRKGLDILLSKEK